MSVNRKRKMEEGSDDYSGGIEDELSKSQASHTGNRNTIDSDEEDVDDETYNKKKYDVLDEEDIEGQEDATIDFDGQTRITPFNMKDELEEGYFDANGSYIWNKKDASEIKDSWLDSVDWVKLKQPTIKPEAGSNGNVLSEDFDKPMDEKTDVLGLYKELLNFLQKGESVLKAVKRIGGKAMTASEKLKHKKAQKLKQEAQDSPMEMEKEEMKLEAEDVEKLTEVANAILSATGNMDIYQETFESVTFKIKRESMKLVENTLKQDDGCDMFGDDFEVTKLKSEDKKLESSGKPVMEGQQAFGNIDDASEEVNWEFKWEDKEEAPIYGPHSSTEMNAWVSEGYFKDGVLVRKVNQAGPFYSSKRIDFDLYS